MTGKRNETTGRRTVFVFPHCPQMRFPDGLLHVCLTKGESESEMKGRMWNEAQEQLDNVVHCDVMSKGVWLM